jgi:hypothetical protein
LKLPVKDGDWAVELADLFGVASSQNRLYGEACSVKNTAVVVSTEARRVSALAAMAGKGENRKAFAWSIVLITLGTLVTAVAPPLAAQPVSKQHRRSRATTAPASGESAEKVALAGKNSNRTGEASAKGSAQAWNHRSSLGAKLSAEQARKLSLLDPRSWPFSLIPVPEIATDPDNGTTIGVLPVLLFNNDQHQITSILAPDIFYNTNVGAGGHFRMLVYPSEDTQWHVIAGAAQNIAQKVDLFYSTGRQHNRRWSFDLRFYYEKDPTDRFYGIGNETPESGESNFTLKQIYGEAKIGWNITLHLQLELMERPKFVRILHGALAPQIPYIGQLYPGVKGLEGGTEMMNRVMLGYDNRNSIDIPRRGGLYRLFYGVSERGFLSSSSYNEIGAEARHYVPLSDRVTLAGHTYIQLTPAGNEAPFWAMPNLGGQESLLAGVQTLRGFGAGRFTDNNLAVFNLECRTWVYEREIFDTHGIVELAPFIEAGRVYHDFGENPLSELHPAGGIGIRGIAQPFIVGYVDVGFGGEGPAIFSGVNYPF